LGKNSCKDLGMTSQKERTKTTSWAALSGAPPGAPNERGKKAQKENNVVKTCSQQKKPILPNLPPVKMNRPWARGIKVEPTLPEREKRGERERQIR